jgi:hypothetical protein
VNATNIRLELSSFLGARPPQAVRQTAVSKQACHCV